MILIEQIKLSVKANENELKKEAAAKLRIDVGEIKELSILKKSVDARKKPELFLVYSVLVSVLDEAKVLKKCQKINTISKYEKVEYVLPKVGSQRLNNRPVIIGAGPAGLFAGYILALCGFRPLILERGKAVAERTKDVVDFWNTGVLDPISNVQFGEGGAGTFSDGKLNTLVKDKSGRNRFVLETFVKFGANENILYENKPHIGTDTLFTCIENMRKAYIELGGEIRFLSKVEDFIFEDKSLKAVVVNGQAIDTEVAILAIGHSARDTFYKLNSLGVNMEAKDFAVGFRVEHPQSLISMSQYGPDYEYLAPAAYKLTHNLENNRGVYSFCMCPGGHVVNSSSEEGHLVVNGMSYTARDSANANSAIVVTVGSKEYDKSNPLAAVEYQRTIEKRAFDLCNGKIPQQLFADFKQNVISSGYGAFDSVTKGQTSFSNLRDIYSNEINESIILAFESFGHKIKGFDRDDAIFSGIESRTSSPVRISRDEEFNSNFAGLMPCGEGAGYAGGIMSAAMDGMKVAEKIISKYCF